MNFFSTLFAIIPIVSLKLSNPIITEKDKESVIMDYEAMKIIRGESSQLKDVKLGQDYKPFNPAATITAVQQLVSNMAQVEQNYVKQSAAALQKGISEEIDRFEKVVTQTITTQLDAIPKTELDGITALVTDLGNKLVGYLNSYFQTSDKDFVSDTDALKKCLKIIKGTSKNSKSNQTPAECVQALIKNHAASEQKSRSKLNGLIKQALAAAPKSSIVDNLIAKIKQLAITAENAIFAALSLTEKNLSDFSTRTFTNMLQFNGLKQKDLQKDLATTLETMLKNLYVKGEPPKKYNFKQKGLIMLDEYSLPVEAALPNTSWLKFEMKGTMSFENGKATMAYEKFTINGNQALFNKLYPRFTFKSNGQIILWEEGTKEKDAIPFEGYSFRSYGTITLKTLSAGHNNVMGATNTSVSYDGYRFDSDGQIILSKNTFAQDNARGIKVPIDIWTSFTSAGVISFV